MPHSPSFRDVPGSDTAVLFVHGILGTPDHFLDLLPLIPESWSYANLLLPGHGGSVRDFARASMVSWRDAVTEGLDRLAQTHRRLLLVGHSMGTLFCINEALHRSDKVAGLFLLAPPLYPMLTLTATRQSLQVSFGQKRSTAALQAAYDACSITHTKKLWQYLGWIPRFTELFQAARMARMEITELTVPVVAVHSQHDELVSRRSCRVLENADCATLHTLPSSGHFYYPPEDLATLQSLFQAFINTHT